MLSKQEITGAAQVAANKSGMPIDFTLHVRGGTYQPPDEAPREIIHIKLVVDHPEGDLESLEVVKVLLNAMTRETLEIYILGFIQGVMQVVEAADLSAAIEDAHPAPPRLQ